MSLSRVLLCVLALPLLLVGCAENQTSVDRNARHAAAELAQIHFDPTTRESLSGDVRALKPGLTKAYELGKRDFIMGRTVAQAQQRVVGFKYSKAIQREPQRIILGQKYAAENPEQSRQILLEAITNTYWDGYYGRP